MAARAAWGLPQDKQIVMFGALHALTDPRKGFSYLTEALRLLAERGWGERAVAVVFGATGIEGNFGLPVRFVGHVGNNEMAKLYAAADVMVTPSLYENAAKTVMESLACGTPVTAFANTGQFDLIDHKLNGYLAQDRSAADLAAGIAWCLEQSRTSAVLSCQARLKAVSEFNVDAVARDYLMLYERLLAAKRERDATRVHMAMAGDRLGPVLDRPVLGASDGGAR
jgi:glycosyltransferase involved in cell wall biosynthesis